jgi:hypothetical protein
VTLRYASGKWRVAADQMRRRPISSSEISALASAIRREGWDPGKGPDFNRYNPKLWAWMLDMIYSGNPDQAFRFFDLAWPAEFASEKDQFRHDFLENLHSSRYWRDVSELPSAPVTPHTPEERDAPLCAQT